jgi:hypothetical protein
MFKYTRILKLNGIYCGVFSCIIYMFNNLLLVLKAIFTLLVLLFRIFTNFLGILF